MRVEDVAARAGREMRVRFDGAAVPELVGRRTRSPARRALVVAIAVVLVAVGLTTLVRSGRSHPIAAGSDGPMWQRVSIDRAFGGDATVDHVASGPAGFIAAGGVSHRCLAAAPLASCLTPALWRSPDGVRWKQDQGVPGDVGQIVALASNRDRLVFLAIHSDGSVRSWAATADGSWRRGEVVTNDPLARLNPRRRGFMVSVGTGNHWDVRTSPDGLHWSEVPRGVRSGFPPAARLADEFLASDYRRVPTRVLASSDGLAWHAIRSNRAPDLIGSNDEHTQVLGIALRRGAHLYSTRDAKAWSEVYSFHTRFPAAQPYAIEASGRWWILSGNQYASGTVQPEIWVSADLEHWIQRPIGLPRSARLLQRSLLLAARDNRVVALDQDQRSVLVWHRPRHVPTLVRVSGVWTGVGGPAPGALRPMRGSIVARSATGRTIERTETDEFGRYAFDLPPGRYVLTTSCETTTVPVIKQTVHPKIVCNMK